MMERLRAKKEAEARAALLLAEAEREAEEYGRHVHHEGHDEGEFRYLPCLCQRHHSHRKPA